MSERAQVIEKDRVARSFLRGLATYEDEAVVQKLVNERLVDLLEGLGRARYERMLEVGSCTGMFSRLLHERFSPRVFYLNDLVPEFYPSVRKKLEPATAAQIHPLFGDIEHLELPEKLDLTASSSTLQWLENLPRFFGKVERALADDGVFAFSMFGEDTCYEIRELTGAGLRYPSFTGVLSAVSEHFTIVHADVGRDHCYFDHPRDVLAHIRATGVGGVGGFRLTPRRYERFVAAYIDRFSTGRGVMLSYVSYLVIARKRGA